MLGYSSLAGAGSGGAVGAGYGGAVAANNQAGCCAVAVNPGDDCTACGIACGGSGVGTGSVQFVGQGKGAYVQETTFNYVGRGGDFSRRRFDFTCLVVVGSLLLVLPILLWLLCGLGSTQLFDCDAGFLQWESLWTQDQQQYCCATVGRGCPTTQPATAMPTSPPTPPPTPPPTQRPADPFNCAINPENTWAEAKKKWCCTVHRRGCVMPPFVPPVPRPPADPYNCADGFANWQAGWSVGKKNWCCKAHGKGCPNQGNGCVTQPTSAAPYDCNAGFANWMVGWSVSKKAWCCQNSGKGCPPTSGGCA